MSRNKTRKSSTRKLKTNIRSLTGGAYGTFTRYGPRYPTRSDPRIPKWAAPENINNYLEVLAEEDEKTRKAELARYKAATANYAAKFKARSGDKIGAKVPPSRSSASQERRRAAQAADLLEQPNKFAVGRMMLLNDEITLSELERRVKICELLLLHMNRVFATKNNGLFDNDKYRLSPQFIDDFVFIPNKDGETLLGQIRHNYHPVSKEDRISIYGSPYYIPDGAHGSRMDPGSRPRPPEPSILYSLLIDDIQFLNKRKVKTIYPGVISEKSDPNAIETEVITYGDITSALFETRLQIREYNQRPRNKQGKPLNFSIQHFTSENQRLNGLNV
jgi:hypothetical protein